MKHVVVAFDSFKGSLTSADACEAFAVGYREVCPDASVCIIPISDGGEGFSDAVASSRHGESVECCVTGPLGGDVVATYTILDDGTAVISLAAASGLTLIPAERRNPLLATTYGTGELILDALGRGSRRIIIGLGGSATTDGGSGMLRALGFRFFDDRGCELTSAIDILERAVSISGSDLSPAVRDAVIEVAVDVDNPLYGPRGAAYVYAPQEGADAEMVQRLDRALRHYASLGDSHCGYEASATSGVGAAGGVGYAFVAFLGRELTSGIELLLDIVGLDAALEGASLVVTGEGRIDEQTLMGKAPVGVLRRAQRHGVPCVAVGGMVAMSESLAQSGFSDILAAKPASMPLSEAMKPSVAYDNLRAVGRGVASAYSKK